MFIRGIVPPYETSHMPPNVAGHLPELADLAGFYSAFGLQVQGERPDHLLPELEFVAFLSLKYLEASGQRLTEAADTCADALASFVEDHLGAWLGTYANKVSEQLPHNPYEAVIASLASFVSWLCIQIGITPRDPGGGGPVTDPSGLGMDEEDPPGCVGCPLPGEREIDIPG